MTAPFSATVAGGKVVQFSGTKTSCTPRPSAVTHVRVVDGGEGYTSVPTLKVSGGGGTVTSGSLSVAYKIDEITLESGGQGYLDSPSVSPAICHAAVRGSITSLEIVTKGEDYKAAPSVSFARGTGAEATATIDNKGRVATLTLTAGGKNYHPNPVVTLEGGEPKTQATAKGKISGSVVSLEVLESLTYAGTRTLDGKANEPSTTVTFLGDCDKKAQATASYIGTVSGITLTSLPDFTSPPSISITGGGGKGAAAVAEIAFQQSHTLRRPIQQCLGSVSGGGGYDITADGEGTPPFDPFGYFTGSESAGWSARVATDPEGRRFIDGFNAQAPLGNVSLLDQAWFFPGEALWAELETSWGVPGFATDSSYSWFPCSLGFFKRVAQTSQTLFVKRLYSRAQPSATWDLVLPDQSDATRAATFLATYTQYVDTKGDSVWYLEELNLADGGENLYVPLNDSVIQVQMRNSRHKVYLTAAFVRTAPEAKPVELNGFSDQPVINVEFRQLGNGNYEIESVEIESGGLTQLEDETSIDFSVELLIGHAPDSRPRLRGLIREGSLHSVSIPSRGVVIPGASISSNVPLTPDPFLVATERFVTGETRKVVEREHTAPSLSAQADMAFDTDGGEFSVSVEQETDANGETYWKVSEITCTRQPQGTFQYTSTLVNGVLLIGYAVIIEPDSPAIAAVPAMAFVTFELTQPNPADFRVLNPDEANPSFIFDSFGVQEFLDSRGFKKWRLTGGSITEAGQELFGCEVGDNFFVTTNLGSAISSCTSAVLEVTAVDEDGKITAWEIAEGGEYYVSGATVDDVKILDGGKYFVRTVVQTDADLPDEVACIGPINESAGWEPNHISRFDYTVFYPAVGESISGGSLLTAGGTRTRRCQGPTVALSLE
jgi:hypothetical protein